MSRVNNQYSQEYKDRAFDILGKRGFTGHEHILGDWNGTSEIEIINMNGRIYDPRVGQFMQPDNNIQTPEDFIGYDRYAYCRNNPLKYTDPSGEFIFTTLAMFYPPLLPLAIAADIGWMRVVYHPNSDLSSGYTWGLMFQSIVSNSIQAGFTMVIKEMIPTAYILGNENSLFSVGISPSFHFSSNGVAVGGVLSSNFTPFDFLNIGVDLGMQYNFVTTGTNKQNQLEFTAGAGVDLEIANVAMIGLYSNYVYSTDATSQRVGGLKLGGKGTNWDDYIYIRYENDGAPFNEGDLKGVLNDNNDRYRTNGFEIGYGDLNLRLLMFTGSAATSTTSGEGSEYPYGYYKGGDVDKYRLGALSLGYGQYRIGLNSEYIRNVFQNQFAHKVCKPQAWFKKLSTSWDPYFYYGTTNRYSLWF